ncbi:hypothetical protein CI109_105280 [Kwoniella shandongensis]|uniref:NmrA-like domain-containing protein n=1 Tax=Kwoniella shandongensis TaxID=1734106 RepID=A0A5M6C3J6_9TREE|nr:uncharacterized protein CI109_002124 [Kwoniella shandongensis]KAA5529698.1 hypothetical protein CI109_002124 [Kwoniella shandongensis]
MSLQNIIVFVSTGKQGQATVQALSDLGKFKILAVSRDPSSEAAQALAKIPRVEVVKGEVGDHEHLFNQPIHGVFFVQMGFDFPAVLKDVGSLLDLSEKKGVKHVVFSGTDQCGKRDVGIGHPFLDCKKDIEDLVTAKSFDWTIIRPVGFLENFYWPPYLDQVTTTWKETSNLVKKVISVIDIGKITAEVFAHPEKWAGKAINIAGDSLTPAQMELVWKETTGKSLDATETPQFPPGMAEAMDFFNKHEFEASSGWTRENFPFVLDLKAWLKQSSFVSA